MLDVGGDGEQDAWTASKKQGASICKPEFSNRIVVLPVGIRVAVCTPF